MQSFQGLYTKESYLVLGRNPMSLNKRRELEALTAGDTPPGCHPLPYRFVDSVWRDGDGVKFTQEQWILALCPDHNPEFQRREYLTDGREADHYKCAVCGQGEVRATIRKS